MYSLDGVNLELSAGGEAEAEEDLDLQITTVVNTAENEIRDGRTDTEKEVLHVVTGQGLNGRITGISHLEEEARFVYDPRTGALVETRDVV